MIALIVIAVIALVAGIFAFFALYERPSCMDGKQNQDEEGIDCGGACSKLCVAPRVSALWTRSVRVAPGVYHAVAMVQNPETGAGTRALPYTFSLYDSENVLVAERDGTMVLEPGEVIPLFEANVITGERVPVRTLVSFGRAEWNRTERTANPLAVGSVSLDAENLQVSVRVSNTSAVPVSKATLTALIYGEGDILVAASETVVTGIPARGVKDAVFTWQEPFSPAALRAVVTSRIE